MPQASPIIIAAKMASKSFARPSIERKRISENAPKIAIEVPRLPLIIIITAITKTGRTASVTSIPLVVCEVLACVKASTMPSSNAIAAAIKAVVISRPGVVVSKIVLNIFYPFINFTYFTKLFRVDLLLRQYT